jgi:hypothetical protein
MQQTTSRPANLPTWLRCPILEAHVRAAVAATMAIVVRVFVGAPPLEDPATTRKEQRNSDRSRLSGLSHRTRRPSALQSVNKSTSSNAPRTTALHPDNGQGAYLLFGLAAAPQGIIRRSAQGRQTATQNFRPPSPPSHGPSTHRQRPGLRPSPLHTQVAPGRTHNRPSSKSHRPGYVCTAHPPGRLLAGTSGDLSWAHPGTRGGVAPEGGSHPPHAPPPLAPPSAAAALVVLWRTQDPKPSVSVAAGAGVRTNKLRGGPISSRRELQGE